VQKAAVAATSDASGIIVVNNSTSCLGSLGTFGLNDTAKQLMTMASGVFVASADNETGSELYGRLGGHESNAVVTSYQSWAVHRLDPASLILLVLALVTIAIAAVWSGHTFETHIRKQYEQRLHGSSSVTEDRPDPDSAGAIRGVPLAIMCN
jgi:hypothetical protein